MALNHKRVWCDFFQCQIISGRADLPPRTMEQIFEQLMVQLSQPGLNTIRAFSKNVYEIRELHRTDLGYRGVIAKYKKADLPHAAIPGGEERELDLEDDEQLLEKSSFYYYSDHALLILQRNRSVVGSIRLGQYFSQSGYTVSLNPVIEAADLRRLMAGDVNIRVADFSIARPTNPELFEGIQHNFNNSIIQSLGASNAAKLNVVLRGDGHSKDPGKRYLEPGLKRALLEMKDRFDLQKAQLELEDSAGTVHPLDLITDRLTYDEVIAFEGRYPSPELMLQVLKNARDTKEPELENYFGALADARLN